MEEIQDRVLTLITTKGLTNAEFAEAIGVQPSNISHIMSGRNKPSLELIMKIIRRFPEVRPDWILNGEGAMNKEYNLFGFEEEPRKGKLSSKSLKVADETVPLSDNQKISHPAEVTEVEISPEKPVNETPEEAENLVEKIAQKNKIHDQSMIMDKKIEKIVIFYDDRTFREYFPED